MNKKLIFGIIILAIILIIAYVLISPAFIVKEANEIIPMDSSNTDEINSNIISQGQLIPEAHEVAGKALIIESGGKKYLRFENLDTINGPDLRIYLSADLEAGEFIDLGEIKATKGNVNYEIPEGTDLEKYNKALIWCRAFRVLFSYAELK